MTTQRTALPANFVEQRTAFANALGKATAPLDDETIKVALMSAVLNDLWSVTRIGELQTQVDRLESQLAALQRAQASTSHS
jgi:hypothetical protein